MREMLTKEIVGKRDLCIDGYRPIIEVATAGLSAALGISPPASARKGSGHVSSTTIIARHAASHQLVGDKHVGFDETRPQIDTCALTGLDKN